MFLLMRTGHWSLFGLDTDSAAAKFLNLQSLTINPDYANKLSLGLHAAP